MQLKLPEPTVSFHIDKMIIIFFQNLNAFHYFEDYLMRKLTFG